MPNRKRRVVKAWAFASEHVLVVDELFFHRPSAVKEKRENPSFWKNYKIVPVEIREILPPRPPRRRRGKS